VDVPPIFTLCCLILYALGKQVIHVMWAVGLQVFQSKVHVFSEDKSSA
jgi:hypothetical protein